MIHSRTKAAVRLAFVIGIYTNAFGVVAEE